MRTDSIKSINCGSGAQKIKMFIALMLTLALMLSFSYCSDPLAYAAAPVKGTVINCNYYINVRSGSGAGSFVCGHMGAVAEHGRHAALNDI